jgi:hypothetical protein
MRLENACYDEVNKPIEANVKNKHWPDGIAKLERVGLRLYLERNVSKSLSITNNG